MLVCSSHAPGCLLIIVSGMEAHARFTIECFFLRIHVISLTAVKAPELRCQLAVLPAADQIHATPIVVWNDAFYATMYRAPPLYYAVF